QDLQKSNHNTSEFKINGNMECSNTESQVVLDPYPLDLQDNNHNTSEFKLNGNVECLKTEETHGVLDFDDTTWDFSDERWETIEVTNLNPELNLDVVTLANTIKFDLPKRVKHKSGYRKTKSNHVYLSAGCAENIVRKMPGVANRDRSPNSWEFLMRLLVNPETNPSLIKWDDESLFIFRLVDPDMIVQIWNTKSEKSSANYDNFARSLRYHYKKGVLIPIPEKQLVYRCGPKAITYINNLRKV
ncbi:unnamed protein product, partial [Meganyctiphanes norvegica]